MNPIIQFKNIRVLLPLIASALVGGAFTPAAAAPQPQYTVIDLGEGVGNVISDSGQIVGMAVPFSSSRALFWASSQSTPMELPGLPVGLAGQASSMNPRGEIVGAFFSPDGSQRAVFWPRRATQRPFTFPN
jgi:hypothetical protein